MRKSCKHTPLKKYKIFEKFNSSVSKHIHFGKNNLDSINEKSSYILRKLPSSSPFVVNFDMISQRAHRYEFN